MALRAAAIVLLQPVRIAAEVLFVVLAGILWQAIIVEGDADFPLKAVRRLLVWAFGEGAAPQLITAIISRRRRLTDVLTDIPPDAAGRQPALQAGSRLRRIPTARVRPRSVELVGQPTGVVTQTVQAAGRPAAVKQVTVREAVATGQVPEQVLLSSRTTPAVTQTTTRRLDGRNIRTVGTANSESRSPGSSGSVHASWLQDSAMAAAQADTLAPATPASAMPVARSTTKTIYKGPVIHVGGSVPQHHDLTDDTASVSSRDSFASASDVDGLEVDDLADEAHGHPLDSHELYDHMVNHQIKRDKHGRRKAVKAPFAQRLASKMFSPVVKPAMVRTEMMGRRAEVGLVKVGKYMERALGTLGAQLDTSIRAAGVSAVDALFDHVQQWVLFGGSVGALFYLLVLLPSRVQAAMLI